jgi:hypothetical protein
MVAAAHLVLTHFLQESRMKKPKLSLCAVLIWAVSGFTMISAATVSRAVLAADQAKETLRPEVSKPLQEAQELMKSQKYPEALAKIDETDALAGKSAFESYLVASMRGAAASAAGNMELAASSFETVLTSGLLPVTEQLKIEQALAGSFYQKQQFGKAITWSSRYFKEGGSEPQMRTVLSQSYYLGGDYTNAARELQAGLQADDSAGRTPREDQLRLLANCYLKQSDNAGYAAMLERLVQLYPKKDYWADLINRIQKKPGFSERLTLDVYRLQQATGNLNGASDYMEMAQLALRAGYPAEGKKVIEQGFTAGVLGTGNNAEQHKKLRDLIEKKAVDDEKQWKQDDKAVQAAKDGTVAVNVGYNYIVNGQFDKGIALLEQGIAKGGLKHPGDARLHLGMAYLLAGQKARGEQTLKGIEGEDGVGDLARLWIIASIK